MKYPKLFAVLCLSALVALPLAALDSSPSAPSAVDVSQTDDLAPMLQQPTLARFDAQAPGMDILAKLHCESVLVAENSETAKLRAVYGDSEENKTFSKYTPAANLEIQITNPEAFGAFEPGHDYLVRFSPVVNAEVSVESNAGDPASPA